MQKENLFPVMATKKRPHPNIVFSGHGCRVAAPRPESRSRVNDERSPLPGLKIHIYILFLIIILLGTAAIAADEDDSITDILREKDFSMSATEFRIRIQNHTDFFADTVEMTADRMMAATTDPVVRKNALLLKISAIPTIYKIFYYPQPLMAGMDAWAFSMQLKNYFKSDEGRDAFGEWHVLGVQAAVTMETRMLNLGEALSKNGDPSPAEAYIRSWSDEQPIRIPILARDSIIPTLSYGMGEKSMGTFKAIGHVPEQLDNIVNWMTSYANHLPKQARWQTELLLSEYGTNEKVDILLAELAAATGSMQQIADVVEQSPDVVARERNAMVASLRGERLETLAYLSAEREIILEALQNERKIVLTALQNERQAAIDDIASMEKTLFQDSAPAIDRIIDRVFLRAAQLAGALLLFLLLAGFLSIFLFNRHKMAHR